MNLDLEYNYEEATSAMDIYSENDMNSLRQWTRSFDISKNVPKNMTDKQILLFYNSCYGDVEKAKACIENYYTCRKNAPELFYHRDLNLDDLKQASEVVEVLFLPGKSFKGHDILFQRLRDTDASKLNSNAAFKLLAMITDLCLSIRGPQSGYIVIFDTQGVKMEHLARINLSGLRKFLQYVQDAAPIRMKGVHVLNNIPILDHLMTIMQPFTDLKYSEIIKFYNKTETLDKLHELVPKSSLPSDYGGTLPDTYTLHKQCMEQLRNMTPYFKAEEEQRRAALPDTVGHDPLEGNFRMLDID